MNDKQSPERLDQQITQALQDVATPESLLQRLLEIGDDEAAIHSSRRKQLAGRLPLVAKRLTIAAAFTVLAAAFYLLVDKTMVPRRAAPPATHPWSVDPNIAHQRIHELEQISQLLLAQHNWLSVRRQMALQPTPNREFQASRRYWREQAAGTMVLAADMQARLADDSRLSLDDYRMVVDQFADTRWAAIAQQRLQPLNNSK